MRKIGAFIVLLGLGITIFTTFAFFNKEKAADTKKTEIIRIKAFHLTLSPITGIAIMGIGGIVFWQTYNNQ